MRQETDSYLEGPTTPLPELSDQEIGMLLRQTEGPTDNPNEIINDDVPGYMETETDQQLASNDALALLLAADDPTSIEPDALVDAATKGTLETKGNESPDEIQDLYQRLIQEETGRVSSNNAIQTALADGIKLVALGEDPNKFVTTKSDGSRSIVINGNPNTGSFQGMGRYGTVQEFMSKDFEGFKRANPQIWARMQADARARAEAPNQLALAMQKNINGQMQLIAAEKDPLKKEMMLSQLKGSVAVQAAQLTRQMRQMAEDELGISRLTAQYNKALQYDIQAGGKESSITRSLKSQLYQAQGQLGARTKQMIAENPTLASLTAQLGGFIKIQEREINQNLTIQGKQDAAVANILAVMGTGAKDLIRLAYPEAKTERDIAIRAKELITNPVARKDWAPIIMNPSFDLRDLKDIGLDGNKMAVGLLAKAESARTGLPIQKVEADVRNVGFIINSDQGAAQALKSIGNTPEVVQLKNALAKASVDTSKEGKMETRMLRKRVADIWMRGSKTNEILGNADNLVGLQADPEMKAAVEQAKMLKGSQSIDLQTLVSSYVNQAPKEQKAARMEKILRMADATAGQYKDYSLGSVDRIAITNRIKSYAATSSIFGDFFTAPANAKASAGNLNAVYDPLDAALGKRSAEYR